MLYRSLVQPVLLYGSEAWVMTQADESALGVFERKLLSKIYGPIKDNGEYRRRMNYELYCDSLRCIKISRLRWLGHVIRMEENVPARKLFDDVFEGRRRPGLRNFAGMIKWSIPCGF